MGEKYLTFVDFARKYLPPSVAECSLSNETDWHTRFKVTYPTWLPPHQTSASAPNNSNSLDPAGHEVRAGALHETVAATTLPHERASLQQPALSENGGPSGTKLTEDGAAASPLFLALGLAVLFGGLAAVIHKQLSNSQKYKGRERVGADEGGANEGPLSPEGEEDDDDMGGSSIVLRHQRDDDDDSSVGIQDDAPLQSIPIRRRES